MPNFKKDDYIAPKTPTVRGEPKTPSTYQPDPKFYSTPAPNSTKWNRPSYGGRGGMNQSVQQQANMLRKPTPFASNIPPLRLQWSPIYGLAPANIMGGQGLRPYLGPSVALSALDKYAREQEQKLLDRTLHPFSGINPEDYLHMPIPTDPWATIERNRALSISIMEALAELDTGADEDDFMFEDDGGGGGGGWDGGGWGDGGGSRYGPDSTLYQWRIGL